MATFSGSGKILNDGQYICKVQYQLHQDKTSSDQTRTSGQIALKIDAERVSTDVLNTLGSGREFTLKLADNREIIIFLNRSDPIAGLWRIVGTPATKSLD
jgi:hypothetical protein